MNLSNKIRLGTIFSGIGAPEQACMRLFDKVENVFACEIDKFARKSYELNYKIDEKHFYTDITKTDFTKYKGGVDLVVGGSPCQSFSLAGKRGGFEDTRGTLFFEYARCIKECEPEYFVYENVKGLVSHDKGKTIDVVLRAFGELGYKIDAKILNTKDYNVPQNRERIYIVGKKIKTDEEYIRKPLEVIKGKKIVDRLYNNIVELHNQGLLNYWYEYEYEKPYKITIKLKDILEDEVDNKYYLSQKFIKGIESRKRKKTYGNKNTKISPCLMAASYFKQTTDAFYLKEPIICAMRGRNPDNPSSRVNGLPTEQRIEFNQKDTSNCLTNVSKDNLVIEPPQLNQIGKINIRGNDSVKRVYSPEGICPTLTTMGGGNREPKIAENIKQSVRNNFIRDYHKIVQEFIKQEKKVFYCECKSGFQDNKVCLTESASLRAGNNDLFAMDTQYRIRKLTPLECFRLQDFPDDFLKNVKYNTKEQLISNSQLYKQAGNSMTVKVVEVVIKNLFL